MCNFISSRFKPHPKSEFKMTNRNAYRWLAATAAVLWLSACSHTPSVDDIPPGATFTTKILADDTKLFTYSQRLGRRGPANNEADDGASEERIRNESSGRSAQFAQTAQRGVEAMLAQNHYCRDRYMVLEQYEEHGKYIVRGECRDAANAAERSKFLQ